MRKNKLTLKMLIYLGMTFLLLGASSLVNYTNPGIYKSAFTGIFNKAYASDNEVNIYSYRQSFLIEPLLEAFTEETGITTNVVYISQGIAEKIELEGENSPADVVLTVDISRLTELKDRGLTSRVRSSNINLRVPAELRDPDDQWFALTRRARIIYASSDLSRAPLDEVTSYPDLAKPAIGDRICIRPLSHIYNLGLLSSVIAQYGEETARDWLAGLADNLARRPQGNDRAQIQAIASGICDYAVANSYYFNLLLEANPELERQIRFITPEAEQGGTHMNVSGMALARYAPNRQNAVRLMNFLVSDEAQIIYSVMNNEIPVVSGFSQAQAAELQPLEQLGNFDRQPVSVGDVADNIRAAQRMVARSGIEF